MIIVAYPHRSDDHRPIHLAVLPVGARPGPDSPFWTAAMRDTIGGQLVVWIRSSADSSADGVVWLRDHAGARTAGRLT